MPRRSRRPPLSMRPASRRCPGLGSCSLRALSSVCPTARARSSVCPTARARSSVCPLGQVCWRSRSWTGSPTTLPTGLRRTLSHRARTRRLGGGWTTTRTRRRGPPSPPSGQPRRSAGGGPGTPDAERGKAVVGPRVPSRANCNDARTESKKIAKMRAHTGTFLARSGAQSALGAPDGLGRVRTAAAPRRRRQGRATGARSAEDRTSSCSAARDRSRRSLRRRRGTRSRRRR